MLKIRRISARYPSKSTLNLSNKKKSILASTLNKSNRILKVLNAAIRNASDEIKKVVQVN
jgi:hypothetical protein